MKDAYKLNFDVIVIGGGPAGTVAAIAAARGGASVLLVERHGYLGGMLTAGGTGPMMSFHAGETQVVRGIADEIVKRLVDMQFSPGHIEDFVGYCSSITPFSSEGLKLVLENMCAEAGVTLLYHTTFIDCTKEDGKITGVRLFAKNGFFEAHAKIYVDASADADLSVSAGVETVFGRESDGVAQPMTLNFLVGGIDRDKVIEYMENNPDDIHKNIKTEGLRALARVGLHGARSKLNLAREAGEVSITNKSFLCFETNTHGQFIVNMTHMHEMSAIDAFDLTRAEIEGRRQAHEAFFVLKKYVPGFENSFMVKSGPNIGIRESRKINGIYKLTETDVVTNVMFEDAVAMGGYPVDVHAPKGAADGMKLPKLEIGTWYSVPYRCLVTEEIENLIVAGRCISTTHLACGATRVTPVLMAISEGAGTAAAIAAKLGCHVKNIDTKELRKKLVENGAFLEEFHR